ncbi:thioredoxin domain-containing protein [Faecalispora anaeroviscerum]|uniref:thioredoxin domain-containing protein n=1 Tax=Faecalispora anaeroviscerum TaxID=2991836 RepID=UPI0024B8E2D2|nr:thioredoxin domain-containing protein [Faecalispora anaeroviscerum]
MTGSNRVPNHLTKEKSPYLLQHAYNPVDWFPWGEQAFEKAKREDKPVFLSIGYSTCHWCHVMAHESFEDDEVAEALNQGFVCIKVDREERPDIDAVYMAVCQAMTGSGGWPMTILMTPEQRPFWAGTYLPKMSTFRGTGLLELLAFIREQWSTNREPLLNAGEKITNYLREQSLLSPETAMPEIDLICGAAAQLKESYDSHWGGFGGAPKFPAAHNLLFLLRYSVLEGEEPAKSMAEHTLSQMFRGGLFDHIGGGFSRYSTDVKWLVPHFEKMLYDNALLAYTYAEAYAVTGRPFYRSVAKRTLDYVLRELSDEHGGFYCGQDADSDGVEGKYYVFTPQEVQSVLGEKDSEIFCSRFDVTEQGNFEGKSIPNLLDFPAYDQEDSHIAQLCRRLYEYRLERTRLHRDDKVLTSWNALMIAALARAGVLLGEPEYLHAAQAAQRFLEENLVDERGRLLLRWREGEAAHAGQLDDYAFYAFSLLELYRSTFDCAYLRRAVQIAEQILELFSDTEQGGLYLYAKDSEQLISRPKEVYDGAIPSGNSVAGEVFVRLAALTGEERWRQAGERQISFLTGWVKEYPVGYAMSLIALCSVLYPSQELICTAQKEEAFGEVRDFLYRHSVPNLTVLLKCAENERELAVVAPFSAEYPLPQEGVQYYLCQNGVCAAPVQELDAIKRQLTSLRQSNG